jgi:hypothetical protein
MSVPHAEMSGDIMKIKCDMLFRIVFWDVLPCKMIIILHGSTSQKTILNIILAAVRT